MKIAVEEFEPLSEGKHEGVIVKVDYVTEPYAYTHFFIENDGKMIKVGFPTNLSKESELGKLMKRFGFELKPGTYLDPDDLVEKRVEFLVYLEEKDDKVYSRVLRSSLKPLKIVSEEKVE